MTLRGLTVAVAFALVACATEPPKPPMPPLPPAVTHPPTMESCDRAEDTLARLDCRRADGSPWALTRGGRHFADECKHALQDGRPWMSNCIQRISDCSMLMPAYRGEWCGAKEAR
jgi:hypothetical protein